MAARIAVVTDVHYDWSTLGRLEPYKAQGDLLLDMAIRDINSTVRPDLLLVLGDLVEQCRGKDYSSKLQGLRSIVERSEAPALVLSGNHDGPSEEFYAVFDKPPEFVDLKHIRIVPFVDGPKPGKSHWKSMHSTMRLSQAREGFTGPIVMAQHVPALSPQDDEPRFVVENESEAIRAMQTYGVLLAIGGHTHYGTDLVTIDGVHGIGAPALFEEPFPYLEIVLQNHAVEVVRHELGSAASLGLEPWSGRDQ